ncbi:hypothetical protein VI34_01420 [Methylophilales bacterium MBRSG12]|uniref:Uncharacterized protein n=1 Tax=Methylophilales bacterium MBRS-H7 TaxID=1623450 RepID=A0A0H4JAC0_9PROT|nr:hypothetical protein UZ34_01700 [Methylophilales bacterium MBRSF5]AKO65447.1 hypothetical protein VI33_01420 [Methylophilales bacterium MBRS-H7]AKO66767.1 hypothetical protein VI34_01420 [Methylophilales bacterium MBRSG12]
MISLAKDSTISSNLNQSRSPPFSAEALSIEKFLASSEKSFPFSILPIKDSASFLVFTKICCPLYSCSLNCFVKFL